MESQSKSNLSLLKRNMRERPQPTSIAKSLSASRGEEKDAQVLAESFAKQTLGPSKAPGSDPMQDDGIPSEEMLEKMAAERLAKAEHIFVAQIIWQCGECGNQCIPVRRESRCICGHRLKEHKTKGGHEVENKTKCECEARGCPCKNFFFVVAEGAWILRCRCKHKPVEHDAIAPYKCKRCQQCTGFHSPWVCNCGHPWANHQQITRFVSQRSMMENADAQLQDMYHGGKKLFSVRADGLLAEELEYSGGGSQLSHDHGGHSAGGGGKK